jgi:hypothetical protein
MLAPKLRLAMTVRRRRADRRFASHQPRWTIGDFFDDDTLAAWGDVELLRPASGGVRNAVWFAHANGTPCVVRRSERADAALVWELDVIEAVRNHGLGAPAVTPRPPASVRSKASSFRNALKAAHP